MLVVLCGYNKGVVHSCFNKANVSGKNTAQNLSPSVELGGIIGTSEDYSMVKACYNKGNISVRNVWVRYGANLGGLVGTFSGRQFLLTKCGYNVGAFSLRDITGNTSVGRRCCLVGERDAFS